MMCEEDQTTHERMTDLSDRLCQMADEVAELEGARRERENLRMTLMHNFGPDGSIAHLIDGDEGSLDVMFAVAGEKLLDRAKAAEAKLEMAESKLEYRQGTQFGREQVKALLGGEFPESKFNWDSVGHFRLEGGALEPYAGDEIVPGPSIVMLWWGSEPCAMEDADEGGPMSEDDHLIRAFVHGSPRAKKRFKLMDQNPAMQYEEPAEEVDAWSTAYYDGTGCVNWICPACGKVLRNQLGEPTDQFTESCAECGRTVLVRTSTK